MFIINGTHEGKRISIVCDDVDIYTPKYQLELEKKIQHRKKVLDTLFPVDINFDIIRDLSFTVTPINNNDFGFGEAIDNVDSGEIYDVEIIFSIKLRQTRDYEKAIFGLKYTVKPFLHMDLIDIHENINCLNKLLEYTKNNYLSTVERIHYAIPFIAPLLNNVSDKDAKDFIEGFCVESFKLTLYRVPKYLLATIA